MHEPTSSSVWGHQGQACGEGGGARFALSLLLTHLYKAASAEPPIGTVTMTPLPTLAGRAGCAGGCHTVAMRLPYRDEGTRKRVPRLRPGGWPPILSPLPH